MPEFPTSGATKTPETLSGPETAWTWLLVALGLVPVVVVGGIYLVNPGWEFISKNGTKEYANTFVLALIGVGALLVLCGAFYGRIREITIPGGGGLKVDPPPVLKSAVTEAAQAKANETGSDPDVLAAEALGIATGMMWAQHWGMPPQPPPDTAHRIAEQAVEVASQQPQPAGV